MNSTHYLYAAYTATWIIHLSYLWTIVGRYRRLHSKMEELKKSNAA